LATPQPSQPSSAYSRAGVDYHRLDRAKQGALEAAATTSAVASTLGITILEESRGEPASLIRIGDLRLAVVLECLGTKSLLAREYLDAGGPNRYDQVAIDTVAAAVNDLACLAAQPVAVNAYFATGSASFLERHGWMEAVTEGFRQACLAAGAIWAGGESPTLPGLIAKNDIELAASATGLVAEGYQPWLGRNLEVGDEIVLVESNGIHANGISLARQVAQNVPGGLRHRLPSGIELGEALLRPSHLYTTLVRELLSGGVPVHYASHITGHGLRKLMRADRDLSYHIHTLAEVPEELQLLVERAGLDDAEAYATFNMGSGFALYVQAGSGEATVAAASRAGLAAIVAGVVRPGPRQVILQPISTVYGDRDLQIR
jgi:phosphoribosylformylglycinamidine cyclo-ligase